MSDTNTSTAAAHATPRASETNWTTEAADAIEKAVVAVRRQTVDRADGISKAIVYGLIAAGFAVPALLLLLLASFRLVTALWAEAGVGSWASWLTFGGIWFVCGLLAWAKRTPSTK